MEDTIKRLEELESYLYTNFSEEITKDGVRRIIKTLLQTSVCSGEKIYIGFTLQKMFYVEYTSEGNEADTELIAGVYFNDKREVFNCNTNEFLFCFFKAQD